LSRRLGDDPLTRARGKRAKAAEGSTPIVVDSGGEEGAAQVGIHTASRSSYNDVFFQRRGEGVASPQVAAEVPVAPEVPEISEISEIPEIREAAAASGSRSVFDVSAGVKTGSEAAQGTQIASAPSVPTIEETSAKSRAEISGSASIVGPVAEAIGEPASIPAVSQVPPHGDDASKPGPQKSGGFFKRLFGKFK
jgi:hypothetical protein